MLILQRNKDEIINIGDDIEVQVKRINSHCVYIGVTAPKNIEIWRNEIYRDRKAKIASNKN